MSDCAWCGGTLVCKCGCERACLFCSVGTPSPSPSPSSAPRPGNWRDDLEYVLAEIESRGLSSREGNAPGHGHGVPGIWDDDNGAKAGTRCEWCARYAEIKRALAAPASPQGERERALRLRDVLEKIACANFTRLIDAEAAAQDALIADEAASSPHYAEKGD